MTQDKADEEKNEIELPVEMGSDVFGVDKGVEPGGDVILSVPVSEYKKVPSHEGTARELAIILVAIMGVSFIIHYTCTALIVDRYISDNIQKLFNIWLPVISGLVGSACTYYFTSNKNS